MNGGGLACELGLFDSIYEELTELLECLRLRARNGLGRRRCGRDRRGGGRSRLGGLAQELGKARAEVFPLSFRVVDPVGAKLRVADLDAFGMGKLELIEPELCGIGVPRERGDLLGRLGEQRGRGPCSRDGVALEVDLGVVALRLGGEDAVEVLPRIVGQFWRVVEDFGAVLPNREAQNLFLGGVLPARLGERELEGAVAATADAVGEDLGEGVVVESGVETEVERLAAHVGDQNECGLVLQQRLADDLTQQRLGFVTQRRGGGLCTELLGSVPLAPANFDLQARVGQDGFGHIEQCLCEVLSRDFREPAWAGCTEDDIVGAARAAELTDVVGDEGEELLEVDLAERLVDWVAERVPLDAAGLAAKVRADLEVGFAAGQGRPVGLEGTHEAGAHSGTENRNRGVWRAARLTYGHADGAWELFPFAPTLVADLCLHRGDPGEPVIGGDQRCGRLAACPGQGPLRLGLVDAEGGGTGVTDARDGRGGGPKIEANLGGTREGALAPGRRLGGDARREERCTHAGVVLPLVELGDRPEDLFGLCRRVQKQRGLDGGCTQLGGGGDGNRG